MDFKVRSFWFPSSPYATGTTHCSERTTRNTRHWKRWVNNPSSCPRALVQVPAARNHIKATHRAKQSAFHLVYRFIRSSIRNTETSYWATSQIWRECAHREDLIAQCREMSIRSQGAIYHNFQTIDDTLLKLVQVAGARQQP